VEIGPRIAPQEFPGIAKEQVKAIVEKGDPKSVAKAVVRLAYMGQRSEVRVTGHALDEGLVRIAAEVKKNPQDVAGALARAGVTEEEFARRALEEARRLEGTVAGWDRPPVGG
jgi:stage V sporulation protein SpoVS